MKYKSQNLVPTMSSRMCVWIRLFSTTISHDFPPLLPLELIELFMLSNLGQKAQDEQL